MLVFVHSLSLHGREVKVWNKHSSFSNLENVPIISLVMIITRHLSGNNMGFHKNLLSLFRNIESFSSASI